MNWFKHSQRARERIFFHATIPAYADDIISSGWIRPSQELNNHAGWNFERHKCGLNYGEAIYLSGSKKEAIYYASLRLRNEAEQIDPFDEFELYNEDYNYVAVFAIHVISAELKEGECHQEWLYKGSIPAKPNASIWFSGPEWIREPIGERIAKIRESGLDSDS